MKNELVCFASANTRYGFSGFFAERFADVGKLYILKGGPGTGKGRFLRDVATCARTRGYTVEEILCSSDPLSLDAVVLRKGNDALAIADGTAPHVMEPDVPGVREELINLGAFWDSDRLQKEKSRILTLEQYRRACWKRAYDALAAAGKAEDVAVSLWEPTVEQSMIDALAERLSARIGTGEGFSEEHLFQDGMGMRGVVHLDGIRKMAQPCVLIRRFYGLEYRLNAALHACARKRGHHVVAVHDPFDPSRLNGIYLPQSGVGFLIAEQIDAETHAIDLRRCVRRDAWRAVRGEVRSVLRLRDDLMRLALSCMARAGEYHFELEDIYGHAMDFAQKEKACENFCARVLPE